MNPEFPKPSHHPDSPHSLSGAPVQTQVLYQITLPRGLEQQAVGDPGPAWARGLGLAEGIQITQLPRQLPAAQIGQSIPGWPCRTELSGMVCAMLCL